MITILLYKPKTNKQYSIAIGYGSKYYGQLYFITVVVEDIYRGIIVNARMLWKSTWWTK